MTIRMAPEIINDSIVRKSSHTEGIINIMNWIGLNSKKQINYYQKKGGDKMELTNG
jgi:hypothetical protein